MALSPAGAGMPENNTGLPRPMVARPGPLPSPRGRNMPPLHFSDEEKDLLLTLAAPIPPRQRQEFLRDEPGPREVHALREHGNASRLHQMTAVQARIAEFRENGGGAREDRRSAGQDEPQLARRAASPVEHNC